MEMTKQNQVSEEHYQKVINQLSQRIGGLTVENASLATSKDELAQENNQLKQSIEEYIAKDDKESNKKQASAGK